MEPSSTQAGKPLLALVMIVKNEASGIVETLASIRPFLDFWVILDTGSTDGTQALIRETMAGVPGELHEAPFVDFSTSRNQVLDLLGDRAVFSLMLSGDETVHEGAALRAFCEAHRNDPDEVHGAYHVKVHFGETRYDHPRLARTARAWRYVGVTHEILVREGDPPPTVRVPDAYVFHDVSKKDPQAQQRRWRLDLDLLTRQQRKSPKDTRTAFYLAQTLECLGQHAKALAAYDARIALGGWVEEVYESLYRGARCMNATRRDWSLVQQRYLDAHAHSPHRAEPLFAVAYHWYEARNWPLCYLFARRGAEIPYPEQSVLFVDSEVYRWKLHDLVGISAYYVGEYALGEAAVRKAIDAHPGDVRLLKNLEFYTSRTAATR